MHPAISSRIMYFSWMLWSAERSLRSVAALRMASSFLRQIHETMADAFSVAVCLLRASVWLGAESGLVTSDKSLVPITSRCLSGGGAKVGVVENWGIACLVFQRSAIDLVQLRVIPFCTEGILDYVNVGFERIDESSPLRQSVSAVT